MRHYRNKQNWTRRRRGWRRDSADVVNAECRWGLGEGNTAPVVPEFLIGEREAGPEPAPRLQGRAEYRKRRADDSLFSRAKNDEAWAIAQNDKMPISDADFAAVIDRVKAAFA
jgi:hypothetical protein